MPIFFQDIKKEAVGGKAQSLAQLTQLGYEVPNGFVILSKEQATYQHQLADFLAQLGAGPWAVRSSAMDEDGAETSFAGQFETFLTRKNQGEVEEAIEACFESFNNRRVQAYAEALAKEADLRLCVIVQNMVAAKAAGVIFSANPVDNRRDHLLINVVEGLGDKLVDGKVEPEQLKCYKYKEELPESQILTQKQLKALKAGVLKMIQDFGGEVDAEWAIDQQGELYWLQARPITTLSKAHFNELDTPLNREDEILTRGNVGEMMPGAVTPLTFSVFGRAIEVGLQDFYCRCGALPDFTEKWLYIKMHYNHLFISISGLYALAEEVTMVKKENIEFNIIGDTLSRSHPIALKSWWRRLQNQVKLIRYLNSGGKRLKALELINDQLDIQNEIAIGLQYKALCEQLVQLNLAYAHHYCTSSQSGSYYTTMTSIMSGAPIPKPESHEIASSLLVDIDGIAGNEALSDLQKIAIEIADNKERGSAWSELPTKQLLTKILGEAKIASKFTNFLENHGHRCIREAELSEKDWSQNPLQIIPVLKKQIQAILQGRTQKQPEVKVDVNEILSDYNWAKKKAVKYFLGKVRKAIVSREKSKSLCIKIQQKIKLGYCRIAESLVKEGYLEDSKQIFFLTHQEIGQLIATKKGSLLELAKERQGQFEAINTLNFADVSYGHPYPIEEEKLESMDGLKGTVVSQGTVTGRVKIIRNLAEADQLEQGDIMVCQYTDIGWTPYFSLIGGLITEIGSPLSHGAVVAREYGIPAVVNVKGAMQCLKDGELLTIDKDGLHLNNPSRG